MAFNFGTAHIHVQNLLNVEIYVLPWQRWECKLADLAGAIDRFVLDWIGLVNGVTGIVMSGPFTWGSAIMSLWRSKAILAAFQKEFETEENLPSLEKLVNLGIQGTINNVMVELTRDQYYQIEMSTKQFLEQSKTVVIPSGQFEEIMSSNKWKAFYQPTRIINLFDPSVETMRLSILSSDGRKYVSIGSGYDQSWIAVPEGIYLQQYGQKMYVPARPSEGPVRKWERGDEGGNYFARKIEGAIEDLIESVKNRQQK
ncbi:hypothetical protein L3Q67_26985 [Saccharothrix sp. AJ9571]|nr:hypothetical protein L3Q67_26985 [Saccharothrix sp. AJ9571]